MRFDIFSHFDSTRLTVNEDHTISGASRGLGSYVTASTPLPNDRASCWAELLDQGGNYVAVGLVDDVSTQIRGGVSPRSPRFVGWQGCSDGARLCIRGW